MPRALPSPTPPTLEYAPLAPWHRRRGARRAMILATLLLAGLSAWRFAPGAWRHAQLLYWQDKCMNYTAPADQVVFSATDGSKLVPEEWTRFYELLSPPGQFSMGTVFLHERIAPNGNRRLVGVDVSSMADSSLQFTFLYPRAFVPGTAFSAPANCSHVSGGWIHFFESDKYYAGQVDDSDKSHFTLRLLRGQSETIIDGWLKDDDLVLLEARATPSPASTQPAP
jgi:hypothetical protein